MVSFLCWIWPCLLGALLGWLAAGWLARSALARQPATVERLVQRIVEKPVVDTAGLAARDAELAELRSRQADLEARLKVATEGPAFDLTAAQAAGMSLKGADDLEVIEGIGPKIAELLRAAGVTRFWQLAQMKPAQIQPILDTAGANYKLAVPDTWPEQAALAAGNHWHALKSLQDVLDAGQRNQARDD